MRATLGTLGVVALAGMLATSCSPASGAAAQGVRRDISALTSGKGIKIKFSDKPVKLPDFSIQDINGKTIAPADWAGKVVLINFWATWCGPCRSEIPELIEFQKHYANELVIVGLSVDEGSPADVKKFAAENGMNYTVAIADEALQKAFGGVPATFVVNPEGGIVQRHVGLLRPDVTEHEIRSLAHLDTPAEIEFVPDTGQVLIANAAYATEIPGVDLTSVTTKQKETILKRLNTEKCTCGCDRTLAGCRIEDPACQTSLPAAKKVAAEVIGGK
jgi:thiol-disulfide isomerase/thioredoxin